MKKAKKWLDVTVVLLTVLAVGIIALYIYFVKNYNDFTVKSVQFGAGVAGGELAEKIDEADLENPAIFEFNELTNSNNNGVRLRELRVSYLTKSEGLDAYSIYKSGMQISGDADYSLGSLSIGNPLSGYDTIAFNNKRQDALNAFAYYDGQNDGNHDESWTSERRILTDNNNAGFIVQTTNGDLFCLKLDGAIDVEIVGALGMKTTGKIEANAADLFYYISSAAQSSGEFGTFYLNLDLTPFFSISKWNENSKKFENISVDANYEFSLLHVPVKFTRSLDGYTKTSQSIFGCLNYDATSEDSVVDLWEIKTIYDITNDCFVKNYSEVDNGYLLSLKASVLKQIAAEPDAELHVTIDLNNLDEVVGLGALALDGLPVSKLTIKGSGDFVLKTKALTGTLLKSIHCDFDVKLVFEIGAVDSELEVIVE